MGQNADKMRPNNYDMLRELVKLRIRNFIREPARCLSIFLVPLLFFTLGVHFVYKSNPDLKTKTIILNKGTNNNLQFLIKIIIRCMGTCRWVENFCIGGIDCMGKVWRGITRKWETVLGCRNVQQFQYHSLRFGSQWISSVWSIIRSLDNRRGKSDFRAETIPRRDCDRSVLRAT